MSAGILSLCTGYGGLDLAVEAVTGARTVAVSDLDKGANKILAHRYPTVPNLGDLKLIDWAAWAGTEVMTAGYPCQPFSHAGKREGTDDPRHIFPFIADGIRIVGPRLVVLENVRGHLALGFDTVLGTLANIGYDARWVCVRASDVGAPHRRERLFIVATPHDAGRFGGHEAVELDGHSSQEADGSGVPDESDRGPRWARSSGGAAADASRGQLAWSAIEDDGLLIAPERGRVTAADASGERHGRREDRGRLGRLDGGYAGQARERERSREVTLDRSAEAPANATSVGHGDAGTPSIGGLAATTVAGSAANTDRDGLEGIGRLGTVGHHAHGRDGSREDATDWGQYAPAIHRWAAVLGRSAPAPTEPGAKGQPRLSPRFVEFMMGLPEGWVTDVPDLTRNEQLKALGNGVVPQQAAAALTFLLNAQEVAA